MADRYWVGGTAAWDGTAGTKWATTSGGAGGASVPTSADDVFFTAASGTVTVTVSAGNTGAKSLNFTGFTGTFAGTTALSVAGSITAVASMTWTYSNTITITAAATLTTNGKTLTCGLTFNAAGATLLIADNLVCTGVSAFTLTNGTVDAQTNSVNMTVPIFSSANTNTRALLMSVGSLLTLNGTGSLLVLSPNTNLTTANVTIVTTDVSTTAKTLDSGTFSASYVFDLRLPASSATIAVLGGNFNSIRPVSGTVMSMSANVTFGGFDTSLLSAGNMARLVSNVRFTQRTLSVAVNQTWEWMVLEDMNGAGGAGTITVSNGCNLRNNTGFNFTSNDSDIAAIKAKTDQLAFTGGNVNADVEMWLGTAVAAPTVAGVPEVDVTHWLGTAVTATVAGVPNVNSVRINNSSAAASALGQYFAAANLATGLVADSGTTTTLTDSLLSQADVDYWKGMSVYFTSGTLIGLSRTITAFDPATDTITFTPALPVAVSTQTYLLLPAGMTNLDAKIDTIDDMLDTEIPAIKAKTDQLNFSAGAFVMADMQYFEGSTDVAAGIRNSIGLAAANMDTQLSTIDTVADGIKAKTDNLPSDPADASVIAASFATVSSEIATVDLVVDAIKAKTDNLPSDPADASVIAASFVTVSAETAAIFNRIGAPAGASTSADIAAVKAQTAAIQAKTDNLPSDPADASVIAGRFDAVDATLTLMSAGLVTINGNISTVISYSSEVWALMGLDIANPMTVTTAGRVSGTIEQVFTGDGIATTTVTRQP